MLELIPEQFDAADLTHDAAAAGRVRTLGAILAAAAGADPALRSAAPASTRLWRDLRASQVRLQPWPLPQTMRADSGAASRALRIAGAVSASTARPYDLIRELLSRRRPRSRAMTRWRRDSTPPAPTRCSRSAPSGG